MYPPLDSTSNSAGGKGIAGLQSTLVGRKWEGSDIPKSILEAGDLFAGRMRMTRAMRQLWDERERYLKFERGWDEENDDIDDLDLETDLEKKLSLEKPPQFKSEPDYGPDSDIDPQVKHKLELVERFYVCSECLSEIPMLIKVAIVYPQPSIPCYRSLEGRVGKRHRTHIKPNRWTAPKWSCPRISIRDKPSRQWRRITK